MPPRSVGPFSSRGPPERRRVPHPWEVRPVSVGAWCLRVVLGSIFIGHGTQKLFGWWNGGGGGGTAAMFDRGGFRPALPFAILAGLAETVGGALLLLGLLTPLGAAAVIG